MDLDGHKAVTVNNIYSGGSSKIVPWTPVGDTNDWPSSKPSSSGKKPSNTPSGAYTSDGFDGGSSYHYVPPPPDPRQYYRSLVVGPFAYSTNSHDYIYNQLNKNQSIKELATSNSGGYGAGNYSMLYASTTTNLSKAQTELVSNNARIDFCNSYTSKYGLYEVTTTKNPRFKSGNNLFGYEYGDIETVVNGDDSRKISTYISTSNDSMNVFGFIFGTSIESKGIKYSGDYINIQLESSSVSNRISINYKDKFGFSASYGDKDLSFSVSIENQSIKVKDSFDKISLTLLNENKGVTEYTEYYINSPNLALALIPTLSDSFLFTSIGSQIDIMK